MEGELIGGDHPFIRFKGDRCLPLTSSRTYTEERTYTGVPRGGGTSQGSSYHQHNSAGRGEQQQQEIHRGSSWHGESSSSSQSGGFESSYSTHGHAQQQHVSSAERKVTSKLYGREDDFDVPATNLPRRFRGTRLRRNVNIVDVDDFVAQPEPIEFVADETSSRVKRQAVNDPFASFTSFIKDCTDAECAQLKCIVGPLENGQEAWISVRYRISARTLMKVAYNETFKLQTRIQTNITQQPYIGTPSTPVVKVQNINTLVQSTPSSPVGDVVPLWVVVLAACLGTVILLLLIFLLHKVTLLFFKTFFLFLGFLNIKDKIMRKFFQCGFFKRNRPTDAPERQPLNRNGHFHDDH